jgi:hypothetical protein
MGTAYKTTHSPVADAKVPRTVGDDHTQKNRGNMSSEASLEKKPGAEGPQRLDASTSESILTAIASLRYGSVEVTVHDGRVVMIDRRERIRLAAGGH